MRLPQSILQPRSVRNLHFLAIGIVTVLLAIFPPRAAASPQLTATPSGLKFGDVIE